MSTRTRVRGVVVGSDGPDVVVGRATTKGTQQTEISKALTPPKKWSYLKLFGWSVLVFLSVGWIVFYVNTITNECFVCVFSPFDDFMVCFPLAFSFFSFLSIGSTTILPSSDNAESGINHSFANDAGDRSARSPLDDS